MKPTKEDLQAAIDYKVTSDSTKSGSGGRSPHSLCLAQTDGVCTAHAPVTGESMTRIESIVVNFDGAFRDGVAHLRLHMPKLAMDRVATVIVQADGSQRNTSCKIVRDGTDRPIVIDLVTSKPISYETLSIECKPKTQPGTFAVTALVHT